MDSIQYFKITSVFYFYVIGAGRCGKPDISKFLIEDDMLSKLNTFWSLIFIMICHMQLLFKLDIHFNYLSSHLPLFVFDSSLSLVWLKLFCLERTKL